MTLLIFKLILISKTVYTRKGFIANPPKTKVKKHLNLIRPLDELSKTIFVVIFTLGFISFIQ